MYIASDDLEEHVTPSHLIMGCRILNLPDGLDSTCDVNDEEFTLNTDRANCRVKHLNQTLNAFWRQWHTEYLNTLREVHAHTARKQSTKKSRISVGQIVLVKDEHLPHGLWRLGLVTRFLPGQDGVSRAAVIRVASRDHQTTTLNSYCTLVRFSMKEHRYLNQRQVIMYRYLCKSLSSRAHVEQQQEKGKSCGGHGYRN